VVRKIHRPKLVLLKLGMQGGAEDIIKEEKGRAGNLVQSPDKSPTSRWEKKGGNNKIIRNKNTGYASQGRHERDAAQKK